MKRRLRDELTVKIVAEFAVGVVALAFAWVGARACFPAADPPAASTRAPIIAGVEREGQSRTVAAGSTAIVAPPVSPASAVGPAETTPPTPIERMVIQAEASAAARPGVVTPRSDAGGGATLRVVSTGRLPFNVPVPVVARYEVTVRYSNDDAGESLAVALDSGGALPSVTTVSTRPAGGVPGSGWNRFAEARLGVVELQQGTNRVEIEVGATDLEGFEFDALIFDLVR